MIFAGYAKVAPEKPQTGWIKLQISPGTGEAKFSLVEGKQVSLGLLQRGVSWLLSYFYGYVYTIPDSLCADTKTISDRASVHKGITNFGAVFTTERRCAASILKVNRHVSDRFSYHSLASCEQVPDRSGSQ